MTAPVPPAPVEYLVTWLRAHQGEFTEEALRNRLLAADHPPADVDAAFEILRLEPHATTGSAPGLGAESPGISPPAPVAWPPRPASEADVTRQRDTVLAFLGAVGAIVGIPWLLAAVGAAAFAVPVAALALLLALVGWGSLRESRHPGVATGLGVALLLVVVLPVVAVVALFGFCLVTGGRLY